MICEPHRVGAHRSTIIEALSYMYSRAEVEVDGSSLPFLINVVVHCTSCNNHKPLSCREFDTKGKAWGPSLHLPDPLSDQLLFWFQKRPWEPQEGSWSSSTYQLLPWNPLSQRMASRLQLAAASSLPDDDGDQGHPACSSCCRRSSLSPSPHWRRYPSNGHEPLWCSWWGQRTSPSSLHRLLHLLGGRSFSSCCSFRSSPWKAEACNTENSFGISSFVVASAILLRDIPQPVS